MSTEKIEALITALKRYVSCEISMINAKLTSFSEHKNKTISNLNYREDKHLESLQDNISFLQKEFLMKNEIIKSRRPRVINKKECLQEIKNLRMHQKLQTILP